MSQKTAWLVCKDPGGTAGILPVARCLRVMGVSVLVVATGKAKDLVTDDDEPLVRCDSVDELLSQTDGLPDAIVTSMCSQGGVGRELTLQYQGQIPIVAVQDFWGARLLTDWLTARPDIICVNDRVGVELVLKAWPDFASKGIRISGFPALDKYSSPALRNDLSDQARQLREQVGVPDDQPMVLVTGQLQSVGELFEAVVESLELAAVPTNLMASTHPRMTKEEADRCRQALEGFRGQQVSLPPGVPFEVAISAADLVVAMYSTTLLEAVCLGVPAISALFPATGQKHLSDDTGGLLTEFPLTPLGLCPKATNRAELNQLVHSVVVDQYHSPAIGTLPWLDGKNAERVAQVVCSVL